MCKSEQLPQVERKCFFETWNDCLDGCEGGVEFYTGAEDRESALSEERSRDVYTYMSEEERDRLTNQRVDRYMPQLKHCRSAQEFIGKVVGNN